jgi:hypothetical protein
MVEESMKDRGVYRPFRVRTETRVQFGTTYCARPLNTAHCAANLIEPIGGVGTPSQNSYRSGLRARQRLSDFAWTRHRPNCYRM